MKRCANRETGGRGIKESRMDGATGTARRWGVALMAALVACAGLWGPAARAAETTIYVLTDVQGTVLAREDAHGATIATYDYRPYGKQQTGPATAGPGYTGHVGDPDTGLVYMQARYYDQEAARFVTIDPIQPIAGDFFNINRYAYVNNNPVANIDPTGMACGGNGEVSVDVQRMRDAADGCDGSASQRSESAGGGAERSVSMSGAPFSHDASDSGPWSAAAIASGALIADDSTGVGVLDDLAIPVILLGAAEIDLQTRTFVTYTLTNASGQVYVGRTSGFGTPESIMMRRYLSHHMALQGFSNPRRDAWSRGPGAYFAIRGREQQLIDHFGGVGSPGVANAIRGVSKRNPAGRAFWSSSNATFGPLAPYTGGW